MAMFRVSMVVEGGRRKRAGKTKDGGRVALRNAPAAVAAQYKSRSAPSASRVLQIVEIERIFKVTRNPASMCSHHGDNRGAGGRQHCERGEEERSNT